MLTKVVNFNDAKLLKESGNIILLQDTLDESGRPLLISILRSLLKHVHVVHVFLSELKQERVTPRLGDVSKVRFHDLSPNLLRGDVDLARVVGHSHKKIGVVFDSLSQVILGRSVEYTCNVLTSLANLHDDEKPNLVVHSVVGLVHADLHQGSLELGALNSTASVILHTESTEDNLYTGKCGVIVHKPDGNIVKTEELYQLTSDFRCVRADPVPHGSNVEIAGPPLRCTPWLFLTAFVVCFGSSMLYGYNIGVLNTPSKIIIQFYNETYMTRYGEVPDPNVIELLWSTTVAVFVLGGAIGAFSSGKIGDVLGRKRGLLLNHFIMFLGAVLEGLTRACGAPELLIAGRFVVGISCGILVSIASMFLTEMSPVALRGAIGTCNQLAITIGIMVAQILGMKPILGDETTWPVLCGVTGVPAFISLLVLPFCPESPRYSMLKHKSNEKQARRDLSRLRGGADVEDEIEEILQERLERRARGGDEFHFTQLLSKELRFPLTISVVLQVAQQWSGINAIFYYSEMIFSDAGLDEVSVQYAILATGVINVIMTVVAVPLMEKLGRRQLLIGPMILMAASMLVITISLNLTQLYPWMSYVSILCVILYVIGFALGLGPIPLFVASEVFRQESRGAAMSVAMFFNWTCNFILAITFRFMQAALKTYTFVVFLFIIVACVLFVIFFVPETKNRTVDDTARDLETFGSLTEVHLSQGGGGQYLLPPDRGSRRSSEVSSVKELEYGLVSDS